MSLPPNPKADDGEGSEASSAAPAPSAAPSPAPSPAQPPFTPMHPLRAAGCMLAAVTLAVAQGFGQSVISANAQQLQGGFGATQTETAWLTAAYLAPNVSLTLALIKIRAQYGLRNFAEIAILGFVVAALLNYAADDLHSILVVRFMSGMAAAPMTSLAFLYMLEPLPPAKKMTLGLSLALTVIFIGSPLTRLISPHLLEVGGWHALTAMEVALAMIGFGLIYLIPLQSPPRAKVIRAADVISYLLIAVGFGCAAVAFTLGPIYWWAEAPWIGALLAIAVATLALAAAIELNRPDPLIDVRWLASPSVAHFTAALLLFRLVLSEQTSGAAGFFRVLGLLNDQQQTLYWVILAGTVAGGLICAALMKPGREPGFHVVALLLLIAGSLMDAGATAQTAPANMYLSQLMIALAAALFLPPAMLRGVLGALARGPQYLLSFVIVFLTTQKLGAIMGAALFSSFVTERQRLHLARLHEQLGMVDPLVSERLAKLGGAYSSEIADNALRAASGARLLASDAATQAYVMAYNDAFLAVAALSSAALAALLVHIGIDAWRARRASRPPGTPAPSAPPAASPSSAPAQGAAA